MPKLSGWPILGVLAFLSACGDLTVPRSSLLLRSGDLIVVEPGDSDTLRSLASRHLGDPALDWVIAEANHTRKIEPGQQIVIPRRPLDIAAFRGDSYQTVPVLAYHGFERPGKACNKVSVTAKAFRQQMAYLRDQGFSVIGFPDLADFLAGRKHLPKKSVILSIDDGFRSSYDVAYPILRDFGYRATVFVYTDFIGAPAALSWSQMEEMVASNVIDIQPHSKTHSNLSEKLEGESASAYRKRIRDEVKTSKKVLSRLGIPMHTFSYPFGAENETVVEAVRAEGFDLGVTVTRGGNPSFGHPYVLRRTQIYCDDNLKTFAKRLETFKRIAAK